MRAAHLLDWRLPRQRQGQALRTWLAAADTGRTVEAGWLMVVILALVLGGGVVMQVSRRGRCRSMRHDQGAWDLGWPVKVPQGTWVGSALVRQVVDGVSGCRGATKGTDA